MSVLRTLVVAFVLCAALAACSRAPVNRDQTVPLTTAKGVDLNRYLGAWFEIARFPNEFERNCVATTARPRLSSSNGWMRFAAMAPAAIAAAR